MIKENESFHRLSKIHINDLIIENEFISCAVEIKLARLELLFDVHFLDLLPFRRIIQDPQIIGNSYP